jgi:hypothetical protein
MPSSKAPSVSNVLVMMIRCRRSGDLDGRALKSRSQEPRCFHRTKRSLRQTQQHGHFKGQENSQIKFNYNDSLIG